MGLPQQFLRLPRGLAALALAAITGATLIALGPQEPGGPGGDFYYFNGQRVQLRRSETETVARFRTPVEAVQRQALADMSATASLGDAIAHEGRLFRVVDTATAAPVKVPDPQAVAAAESFRNQLRQAADIEFAAPVFYHPETGTRLLPTDEVVVKLNPGMTEADLNALAGGLGLTVARRLFMTSDEFVLRLSQPTNADPIERSRVLFETGRVRWAEPNFIQQYQKFDTPNDPRFGQQWHLHNTGQSGGVIDADVDAPEAWDLQAGSSSIVIAVIDDGVEKTHEDLAAAIFTNPGEIAGNGLDDDGNLLIDDVSGWDFSSGDNDASPSVAGDNHGTAVAGVAAARGHNGLGVTGACRNCRILPIKIFTGGTYAGDTAVASAIRYAATKADVLNNSWGGGAPSATLQSAISDAITTGRGGKGAVVMFATGNSASGYGTFTVTGFPAGTYTFRWEYEKDGSLNAGDDTAWLGWVSFPGGELANFESGALPAGWTTGGAANWSVVSDPTHADEGSCFVRAARAGAITHSQSTYLQVTKTVGAGNLVTFRWVSSESGFDGLRVKMDYNNDGVFDQIFNLLSGVPFINQNVAYPAANPESIAVGASSNFDCRSHYSQFGPQLAFVAPSNAGPRNLAIETTDRMGAAGYESTGNYTLAAGASGFGGTSSATPLASGVAGLVLSRNPNLTRNEVLAILQNSTNQVGPEPYVSGRNNRYGYGRLNAYQALVNTPLPGGAPGAFNKTAPSNGATGVSTSPTLSWGASSGATSYEYCYDATNDNACAAWTSTGTNTSVGLSGLSAGTTFYWYARANNASGTTYADGGAFWSFTTAGAAAPGAFGKIAPTNNATGQSTSPTLSWGASSGAASYEYCYDATNDNACAAWTSTGTNTSVALSGLTPGTSYYWYVRSNNASGTTYADGGAFWTFTTLAAPGAFAKSTPASGATGVSTPPFLSWGSSTGATSYEYCYDTTNDNACSGWTSAGTSTSATPTGLAGGTTYYWHVRANNGSGTTYSNGSATAFWSFTTGSNLPGAFGKSFPGNGATGIVANPSINWGSSSGATSYEYCYDTTNDNACSTWTSTGTSTSTTLSGLSGSTTYYWQVRANNGNGATYADGGATAFWSFTTAVVLPPTPCNVLSLNGVNSYAAAAGTTFPNSSTMSSFTAEAWIYPGSIPASHNFQMIATDDAWDLAVEWVPGVINRLVVSLYGAGGTLSQTFYDNRFVVINQWHHVALVYDDTAKQVRIALDGALGSPHAVSITNWGVFSNTFAVGAFPGDIIHFNGLVDNVRVSDVARYASNFTPATVLAPDANTRALYQFGGAAGATSFTDESGNGHTLTGAGGAVSAVAGNCTAPPPAPTVTGITPNTGPTTGGTLVGITGTGFVNGATVAIGGVAATGVVVNGPTSITATTGARAAGLVNVVVTNPDLQAGTLVNGFTYFVPLPGAFGKTSPADGATAVSSNPTLSWAASTGATSYEYCYDTTNDNACASWVSAGTNTSAGLSGLAPNTIHYWHVRANNAGGTTYANGATTAFWSFTTQVAAPGAFGKVSPANGATGVSASPTLSWASSAGATSYEYCYDATNDNACAAWTSTGANTSVGIGGLAAGTTYYWYVRANNAGGTTYADASGNIFWTFTTQVAVPGVFGKAAPADGATSVGPSPTLSWGASTGAASYEYCYDTTNDNACSAWASAGANTSVGLTNLPAGTTHYWHVRAVNTGGTTYADGGATAFWSFTTQVGAPGGFMKAAPSNGGTGVSSSPTLSWGTSAGAANYEYCFDTTNDNACPVWTDNGTNTSVGLAGLASNTTYYWHVRANNPGGTTYADGGATAHWSFTTQVGVPGAFGKAAPSNGASAVSSSPTLSWNSSAGATGYEYCLDATNDDACAVWVNNGPGTSAGLAGLAPGTTYYWHVRASNAGGTVYADAGATSFWSFTTQIAVPGTFGKTAPVDGATGVGTSPTLSWGASAGAAGYEYCYDATNDNACAAWTSTGATTSVGLSGLAGNTTYYWYVRANNGAGTTYADASGGLFWSFTTQAAGPITDADFNGDGKPDLLFENTSAGTLYGWFMDGQNRIGGNFLSQSPIDPNLLVVGVRDFTGDGKPDLLLQNQTDFTVTLHIMDGLTKTGEQVIPIAAGSPWRIVATGDVNNDGFADILWESFAQGRIFVWFMKPVGGQAGYAGPGGAFLGDFLRDTSAAIVTLGATTLGGIGTGDVNGDGKTDLLLQNDVTGELQVWYLDGTTVTAMANLSPASVNSLWKIRAVADYSGDGRPDFIWQHISSGGLYYWQMNGAVLGMNGYLSSASVNPIWRVVGPR